MRSIIPCSEVAGGLRSLIAEHRQLELPFVSGLPSLDRAIGGLRAGEVVLVSTTTAADRRALVLAIAFATGSARRGATVLLSPEGGLVLELARIVHGDADSSDASFDLIAQLDLLITEGPRCLNQAWWEDLPSYFRVAGQRPRPRLVLINAPARLPERAGVGKELTEVAMVLQVPVVAVQEMPVPASALHEAAVWAHLREESVLLSGQHSRRMLQLRQHALRPSADIVLGQDELRPWVKKRRPYSGARRRPSPDLP